MAARHQTGAATPARQRPVEEQRVLTYFAKNGRTTKRSLTRFNEGLRIAAGPNGDSHWVATIDDVEVLDAGPDGAIVKLLFGVHRTGRRGGATSTGTSGSAGTWSR